MVVASLFNRLVSADRVAGRAVGIAIGADPDGTVAGDRRIRCGRGALVASLYAQCGCRGHRPKDAAEGAGHSGRKPRGAVFIRAWQVATKSGTPFRVFTPFWRACLAQLDQVSPALPIPSDLTFHRQLSSEDLPDWGLLPTRPNWAAGFGPHWTPGEAGAFVRLDHFLTARARGYAEGRDFPAERGSRTSRRICRWERSHRARFWPACAVPN